MVDPFCGVGTTCIAATLLGRQGVGLEIDPNCMEAYHTLYKAIYSKRLGKRLDIGGLFATRIGANFKKLILRELNSEVRVMTALETRYRRIVQREFTIHDHLLLATQMHTFMNTGMMFLRFCNDRMAFGDNDFNTTFLRNFVKLAALTQKDERDIANRPNVDSFDGLFHITQEGKKHIETFVFRALYLMFHTDPSAVVEAGEGICYEDDEEQDPECEDEEENEEENEGEDEGKEEGEDESEDSDEEDCQITMSPLPKTMLRLNSAAQANGSPAKVVAFEEKMREVEERSLHSQATVTKPAEKKKKKKRAPAHGEEQKKKKRSE